jgi:hypothetical protein
MGAAELAKGGVGCILVTADEAPDDRPVLLLGIGSIVLAIGATPR